MTDRLFATALCALLLVVAASVAPVAHAAGGAMVPGNSSQTDLTDMASLTRGARLYVNYCSGCHSMKFMRSSRIAEDFGLTQEQIETNLLFTGAKYGQPLMASMPADKAEQWFGKAPPDLSMTGKSRGPDWIYNYLRGFYLDPSARIGWNNTVFPNASMPNVLWQLQGSQRAVFEPMPESGHGEAHCERGHAVDGRCFISFEPAQPGSESTAEFDQTARDIAAFMQYAAEPAALKRKIIGVWVLIFLAFFTFLLWLLKQEYWRDVH